ncbi:hypothetical protein KEM48_001722 [Puccinia striiformis f. sp. tritici PST-130]|nr:hypothetical protein Pst134EB_016415 [Puccinia striiformis f. sp. tritici]KAI9606953.1 hypothetical protein KEM48_001722 [Puccinia striiformis f. sp. tritici PST-130]
MLQGRFSTAWYLQNTLISSSSDPACDVHLLNTIQLGVTYGDENGRRPQGECVWQFNPHLNINDDMYALDSFELLKTSGLNFKQHEAQGINPEYFGELAGIVLLGDVKWISVHNRSNKSKKSSSK